MSSIMHDTAFGQVVRYITKGKAFAQPEHAPDFELPWKRQIVEADDDKVLETGAGSTTSREHPSTDSRDARRIDTRSTHNTDLEQQTPVEKQRSRVLQPKKTPDGIVLIDWYTDDDSANPQNWTSRKKLLTTILISLYTFGVYSSSAIITPAHQEIQTRFNVSYAEASLTLAMYVIGYGIGPLVSEPNTLHTQTHTTAHLANTRLL